MSYTSIITEVGNLFGPHGRTICAAVMALLSTALIIVLLFIALAILRELPKAIRETKARQKQWHPDPEAERREVAKLTSIRRREERRIVEHQLAHDRRQAILEAQARRDSRRLARVAEVQE